MSLEGKSILVTGGAQRIGHAIILAIARHGGNPVIHFNRSRGAAEKAAREVEALGRQAILLQADLADPDQAARLIERTVQATDLFGLVNNASIFEDLTWKDTTLEDWNRALQVNLTAPFLLSQAFARALPKGSHGRIVNLLDWRAERPGADHLPYTISKSALAALTRSLAAALAPRVNVNGLALGAILPPASGRTPDNLLEAVPMRRWGSLEEIGQALIFLLDGPAYLSGEILHLDGGRHLV